jgi:hypothetical protein
MNTMKLLAPAVSLTFASAALARTFTVHNAVRTLSTTRYYNAD